MARKRMRYRDARLSVETRVRDLLGRMTLQEKVRQLWAVNAEDVLHGGKLSRRKARKSIGKGMGQLSYVLRHFGPREGAALANDIQRFAVEETRLGIPIIIHDECLHGCMARGSTSYPQSIGLAATWTPELVRKMAGAIGRETRSRGIRQALSPCVNIARDVRCGRTQESYGEDPHLSAEMAVAFVKGLQSRGVVATPKHFAANYVGDGGRDSHPIHISERLLREIYLPVFEACVRGAGALSIMPAYNSIDGVPCSCDRWLLTDVLRKEWGFKGFTVSDYESVLGAYSLHHVAGSKAEIAAKALAAGMDVDLPKAECFSELERLVKKGKLPERVVDESVRRVLRVKLSLGLFEDPYVSPDRAVELCDTGENRELARELSRRSIVLLKNDGVLPLKKTVKSIAVIGPNADTVEVHYSDYRGGYDPVFGREVPWGGNVILGNYSAQGMKVVTPLEGMRNKVSGKTRVQLARGCDVFGNSPREVREAIRMGIDLKGMKEAFQTSPRSIRKAVRVAAKADVAVLFMGNWSMAEPLTSEGESADRCDLDLPGAQEELIREVCKVNRHVVVVLIGGSAVTMSAWKDDVGGIVEAWYPGEEGGNAIADVLFGDCNPGGKLPITFPVTTGQLPLYYNHKPTGRVDDYVFQRGRQAMFPFGHGLSYTRFAYRGLKVKKTRAKGKPLRVTVGLKVRNAGKRAGDEVVQLYIRDVVSELSRPVKELKAFRRVSLKQGETKQVEFVLGRKDFSYLGRDLKPVLEPGEFEIMVGSSSEDIRLKGSVVL